MLINKNRKQWNLQIGDHVWRIAPWSKSIIEEIVTDFDGDYVCLKGVTVVGSSWAEISDIYPSQKDAIATHEANNDRKIAKYLSELDADTPEQRIANLVQFCLNHNTCPCEEYTEINAIEALKLFAKMYDISYTL